MASDGMAGAFILAVVMADKQNTVLTARSTLSEARKLLKRAGRNMDAGRREGSEGLIRALEDALKQPDDVGSLSSAQAAVRADIDDNLLAASKKSGPRDVIGSLLFAFLFALLLRTFLVEPFKIPSRSMVPTLLEGDQIFVTKLSYGIPIPFVNDYFVRYAGPERGDVVVFSYPNDEAVRYLGETGSGCMSVESASEGKDYIKRVIGVEGDTIEVVGQVVHVNGEPVSQRPFYRRTVSDFMYLTDDRAESWNDESFGEGRGVFTTITHELPAGVRFGPVTVAPGHVFVMGDNRDNSLDSRCWGQVPVGNIKGRAQVIWWSSGHFAPRWERMFSRIH